MRKKSLIIDFRKTVHISNCLYEFIWDRKPAETTNYMPTLEEIVTYVFLKSFSLFLYSSQQDLFSEFDKKSILLLRETGHG